MLGNVRAFENLRVDQSRLDHTRRNSREGFPAKRIVLMECVFLYQENFVAAPQCVNGMCLLFCLGHFVAPPQQVDGTCLYLSTTFCVAAPQWIETDGHFTRVASTPFTTTRFALVHSPHHDVLRTPEISEVFVRRRVNPRPLTN